MATCKSPKVGDIVWISDNEYYEYDVDGWRYTTYVSANEYDDAESLKENLRTAFEYMQEKQGL